MLQDLANCLELILNDPHIEVDRIKNRLDPSYNIVSTQVASVLVLLEGLVVVNRVYCLRY